MGWWGGCDTVNVRLLLRDAPDKLGNGLKSVQGAPDCRGRDRRGVAIVQVERVRLVHTKRERVVAARHVHLDLDQGGRGRERRRPAAAGYGEIQVLVADIGLVQDGRLRPHRLKLEQVPVVSG